MKTPDASVLVRSEAAPGRAAASYIGIAWVHLLLTIVALSPVLWVTVPPLVDYPNHLARLHILDVIEDNPILQERYAVHWSILPNLAMDILLPPLTRFMSIYDAGRVFVVATLLIVIGGTLALHRAVHGRVGLWPTATYLFLYNHVLIFGFLNYLFTIGLCLLALAGWIATLRWSFGLRLAVFSAVSIGLFFAHLFALAFYGLCITGYELWRTRQRRGAPFREIARDWSLALGQFLFPALLLLASPTGDSAPIITYGSLSDKVSALTAPILAYGGPADTALFIFVGIFLVCAIRNRRLTLLPELRYPIILVAAFTLVMPNNFLSVWLADIRLPVALAFLLVAGTRFDPSSPRIVLGVAVVGLTVFSARTWTLIETWRDYDRNFAEFRDAASTIDEGARLLVVQRDRADETWIWKHFDAPYRHMPALAVIDRSVFVPYLFTDPTKQPLRVTDAYKSVASPFGTPITPTMLRESADPNQSALLKQKRFDAGYNAYWANWPQSFDYVLYVHFGADENPMPELLRPVHAGSFFDIYKVVRD